MLNKFADELRKARLSANVSLQQMAAKTRIDIKLLEALDAGDFSFLPELYIKAFIKEYADVIGIDVELTINKYELAKQGLEFSSEGADKKQVHGVQKDETKNEPLKPKSVQSFDGVQTNAGSADKEKQARQKNIVLISLVGVSVVVLVLLFLFVFKGSDDIIVSEKPFEEVLESDNPRYVETQQGVLVDNDGNAILLTDSLGLQILASDTSWIKIIYDDSRAEDFILFPNSQKNLITKNNFKITLGNAGGIQFKLNNQMLNFSGKAKTVAHVMIDSKGLKLLTAPPVLE